MTAQLFNQILAAARQYIYLLITSRQPVAQESDYIEHRFVELVASKLKHEPINYEDYRQHLKHQINVLGTAWNNPKNTHKAKDAQHNNYRGAALDAYLQGMQDRAIGRPLTIFGDERDNNSVLTDAYTDGYDPGHVFVALKSTDNLYYTVRHYYYDDNGVRHITGELDYPYKHPNPDAAALDAMDAAASWVKLGMFVCSHQEGACVVKYRRTRPNQDLVEQVIEEFPALRHVSPLGKLAGLCTGVEYERAIDELIRHGATVYQATIVNRQHGIRDRKGFYSQGTGFIVETDPRFAPLADAFTKIKAVNISPRAQGLFFVYAFYSLNYHVQNPAFCHGPTDKLTIQELEQAGLVTIIPKGSNRCVNFTDFGKIYAYLHGVDFNKLTPWQYLGPLSELYPEYVAMPELEYNPSQAVLLVADSIEQLRNTDVNRLLEDAVPDVRGVLAAYIVKERADLESEVYAVMVELKRN